MLERILFGETRCHVVIDFLLLFFIAQTSGLETLPNPVLESSAQPEVESQSNTTTQTTAENTESNTSVSVTEVNILSSAKSESNVTSVSRATPWVFSSTESTRAILIFGRKEVLDIFPRKNHTDSYTPVIFHNFTGLTEKRVRARSARNIDALIKKRNFRGFIREINAYFRKIPFEELARSRYENADGLYYRAGFYLLLRALEFTPTNYFQDLWEEYGVLAVETEPTVFLFAVELGPDAEDDFKIVENIVEGKSGAVLPRDTKTILCAGISIDREFDCKIRHWKAVLRDKTIQNQNSTEVDTSSTSEEENEEPKK